MSYCTCRSIQNAGVVRNALVPATPTKGGDGIGRKLNRHEKHLAQHFPGMDGRKLLAHQ